MKSNFIKLISDLFFGILLSYAQVFFSKSKLLSWFILLITFTYPEIGFSGLLCSLSSLTFALIFGLNQNSIKSGYYSYNALLVGLGIGYYYEINIPVLVIIIVGGLLTLLIHIFIENFMYKYRLPVLSIPFIISLWTIILATREFDFFHLTDRNIFVLNNIFKFGGATPLAFYNWFNNEFLPLPVKYFFVALGSIFFQDTALSGFIIFIGLFIFSRISSLLALIGFYTAYYFMHFIGIQDSQVSYYYVGFNFILTSIAIGGIFLIPNIYSHLWVILLIPINVIVTIALISVLNIWQLSVYSLTFNIIVLLFLVIIRNRFSGNRKVIETVYQEFMPEKNLYSFIASKQKVYDNFNKPILLLPFWGEWVVWQGYDGTHTHKELYKHALDFVIKYQNKTYKNEGQHLEDYYTYNKLVVSPGNGWVVKIVDGIEDNQIGDVNLQHNWGNSIIIKHADYVYSQMSHLKVGSFKVKEGDYVKIGQPLALVGNSGRSPQPHLHFQVQMYPTLGSPTIEYKFARYILVNDKNKNLVFNSIPKEQEHVENISLHTSFSKAFHFIPGEIIEITQIQNNIQKLFEWEVFTDSLNNTYLYSKTTHSYAYIYKDDLMFYFKSYHGDKNDPLYLFYCSCYHVEFSVLPAQVLSREYPLHLMFPFYVTWWQDPIAPFYRFMKSLYRNIVLQDKQHSGTFIIEADIIKQIIHKEYKIATAKVFINQQRIIKIEWNNKAKQTLYFTYKNKFN